MIFTKSYRSTLLITTPTTIPSIVKVFGFALFDQILSLLTEIIICAEYAISVQSLTSKLNIFHFVSNSGRGFEVHIAEKTEDLHRC